MPLAPGDWSDYQPNDWSAYKPVTSAGAPDTRWAPGQWSSPITQSTDDAVKIDTAVQGALTIAARTDAGKAKHVPAAIDSDLGSTPQHQLPPPPPPSPSHLPKTFLGKAADWELLKKENDASSNAFRFQ